MRLYLLLLSLAFAAAISAQCSIQAEITAAYCNPDGEGYFLELNVDGNGGTGWVAPTLGIAGAYDTDEIFIAGPLFDTPSPNGTILIQDSLEQGCFVLIDIPVIECEDPCFAFGVFTEQASFNCGQQNSAFVYIGYNSNIVPVTIEVFNDANPDFYSETFELNSAGIDILLPAEEEMNLRVTNAAGCVYDSILVFTPFDCGIITGRSWEDENQNGLQDDDENQIVPAFVSLMTSSGDVVDTTSTTEDGFYFFESVEPWRNYIVDVAPYNEDFALTTPEVGDDDQIDSDFLPATFRTPAFFLSSGQSVAYDAGFVNTSCPGLEITTFL
ncbi:MAG: SdrD B-like domain-containing protein, partial [Bacteroidota bacterium]